MWCPKSFGGCGFIGIHPIKLNSTHHLWNHRDVINQQCAQYRTAQRSQLIIPKEREARFHIIHSHMPMLYAHSFIQSKTEELLDIKKKSKRGMLTISAWRVDACAV